MDETLLPLRWERLAPVPNPHLDATDEELLMVVELTSEAALRRHKDATLALLKDGHSGTPQDCENPHCKLARNLRVTLRTTM